MPIPFKGNTSSTVTSPGVSVPMSIDYFSVINKTAGTIGVNVYRVEDSTEICIIPFGQTLDAGEMWEGTAQIALLKTETIKVQATGSVDYNFTLNNIQPENVEP